MAKTMTFKLGAMTLSIHFHDSITCIPPDRAFICLLWAVDRSKVIRLMSCRQLVLCCHYYMPNYHWTYSMLVLAPHVMWGASNDVNIVRPCLKSPNLTIHQANVVEFSTINCLSLFDADLKAWEVSTLSIAIHQWPRPTRRPWRHFCCDASWIR